MVKPIVIMPDPQIQVYWVELNCSFKQVARVFEECMAEALASLSTDGVSAYIENARCLGKMGRGVEPILIFLEEWPSVATAIGESGLPAIMQTIRVMSKSPNGKATKLFLQSMAAVARWFPPEEQMQRYLDLTLDFMNRTTGSIHEIHTTFTSLGLPDFFKQAPFLLNQLAIYGLKNCVEYGIHNYGNHTECQRDYFSLLSAKAAPYCSANGTGHFWSTTNASSIFTSTRCCRIATV